MYIHVAIFILNKQTVAQTLRGIFGHWHQDKYHVKDT